MEFEWDERKRSANIKKHGVDFVRAAKVFLNPTLERVDDREGYGEERRIAIGYWEGEFLVVIYTWRGECRRLISAWKAGRYEQKRYEKALLERNHEDEG
jgi:uncharacterized DUF497 family protein